MTPIALLRAGFVVLIVCIVLTHADEISRVSNPVCGIKSIKASIFGIEDGIGESVCQFTGFDYSIGVIEGDEASLQKALDEIGTNIHDFIVVLFYASWCPFSMTFRPGLSAMASMYPSIPHFAFEESVLKSSILSKYGVNGFPTLFVINTTMRVRYRGSRTLNSLVTFYTDVTGVTESLDETSFDKIDSYIHKKEPEFCPFTWPKSPENMFQQETYLALATLFVVFRSVYLSYPFIVTSAEYARRTRFLNVRVRSLWAHTLVHLNRAIQLFSLLTGCMGIGFFHERKH